LDLARHSGVRLEKTMTTIAVQEAGVMCGFLELMDFISND